MVLRVHFTAEDLARTRIAERADQLWEIVLSMHVLLTRTSHLVFEPWRQGVRARDGLRGTLTLLGTINPPAALYFPDFLTPSEGARGLDVGIEAILRTPAARLREELALLASQRKLPSWVGNLAEGRPDALDRLGRWLRDYHGRVIAPHEARIGRELAAHRAAGARALAAGGWDAVFAALGPSMRWTPPVLRIDYPEPVDRDLELAGRGLLMVPSFFCWRRPVMLADPALPPVLVYPITHAPPWLGSPDSGGERNAVAALLGTTRTAVLEALDRELTTLELARRVGVAPATISHHTSVLREAGLIRTVREANMALHSLTDLGRTLLEGGTSPAAALSTKDY